MKFINFMLCVVIPNCLSFNERNKSFNDNTSQKGCRNLKGRIDDNKGSASLRTPTYADDGIKGGIYEDRPDRTSLLRFLGRRARYRMSPTENNPNFFTFSGIFPGKIIEVVLSNQHPDSDSFLIGPSLVGRIAGRENPSVVNSFLSLVAAWMHAYDSSRSDKPLLLTSNTSQLNTPACPAVSNGTSSIIPRQDLLNPPLPRHWETFSSVRSRLYDQRQQTIHESNMRELVEYFQSCSLSDNKSGGSNSSLIVHGPLQIPAQPSRNQLPNFSDSLVLDLETIQSLMTIMQESFSSISNIEHNLSLNLNSPTPFIEQITSSLQSIRDHPIAGEIFRNIGEVLFSRILTSLPAAASMVEDSVRSYVCNLNLGQRSCHVAIETIEETVRNVLQDLRVVQLLVRAAVESLRDSSGSQNGTNP